MDTYWITSVWKNDEDEITHMLVHPTDEKTVYKGKKMTLEAVIQLESENLLFTCRYFYEDRKWREGAEVRTYTHPVYGQFLKTVPNSLKADNLDNMIDLNFLKS